MELIRIDANDGPILLMHSRYLCRILSSLNPIEVKLIFVRQRRQFWSRESGKGVESDAIKRDNDVIGDPKAK